MLPDLTCDGSRRRFMRAAFAALALGAPTANAHHSFAMFDFQKEVTLEGTVKRFQWVNPHVFIDVQTSGGSGAAIWSVELSSPSHLVRNGWKPSSLRAGDPIRIVIHPLRDGQRGGTYISATRADGTPVALPPKAQGAAP
jgi:hypothetical protein